MAMQRFVADWLGDWRRLVMATKTAKASRKRPSGRLHLLSVREVQTAESGDHSDGGNLILRVRGDLASWVFRFTPPSGASRREMGLGVAWRGSTQQAGESLRLARRNAHEARELLARGLDPIEERERRRDADRQVQQARKAEKDLEQWTLARCTRDYHARVIEAQQDHEARRAVDCEPRKPHPGIAVGQVDPRHRTARTAEGSERCASA